MSMRDLLIAALAVGGLLILLLLYRTNRKGGNGLELADLVKGDDGKWSKVWMLTWGAFAMTTWLMVFLTIGGKVTEGYFGLYSAAWIAPTLARILKT